MLGIAVFIELELADKLFAQVTATAFGKQGVFTVQRHARHVAVFLFAVFANAHVAGIHAFYPTVFVVGNFRGSKAGKDFNANGFGLGGQPAAYVAQAHNVVAVVVHGGGNGPAGYFGGALLIFKQVQFVFGNGRGKRCAFFLPVGDQFVQGCGF